MRINLQFARNALTAVCGSALLLAMGVDTLAMLGRQINMPLLGSIEIVQAAALVAGAGAMLIATIERAHARVSIVFERLPISAKRVVECTHELLGAVFFTLLLAGSGWLIADLWSGHEESELLHIPYKPLRIFAAAVLGGLIMVFVLRAVRSRQT